MLEWTKKEFYLWSSFTYRVSTTDSMLSWIGRKLPHCDPVTLIYSYTMRFFFSFSLSVCWFTVWNYILYHCFKYWVLYANKILFDPHDSRFHSMTQSHVTTTIQYTKHRFFIIFLPSRFCLSSVTIFFVQWYSFRL